MRVALPPAPPGRQHHLLPGLRQIYHELAGFRIAKDGPDREPKLHVRAVLPVALIARAGPAALARCSGGGR